MRNLIAVGAVILWFAIASPAWSRVAIKTLEERLDERRLDPLLSNRNFLASLEKLDSFVRVTGCLRCIWILDSYLSVRENQGRTMTCTR